MTAASHSGSPECNGIVLAARNLGKSFSRGKAPPVWALREISFEARRGEVTGLVGADGAGKTTLIRCAAGLLVPNEGSLHILNLDAAAESLQIQSRIGYMPQRFGLYEELSVRENMDLFADLQSMAAAERPDRFERLLAVTELADFTRRRAGDLSGGMKQKLGLACALLKSPEFLLLDEPTVGVDPVSRRELWEIVYQWVESEHLGVLLATAYMDEAERCHQVVLLDEGKILAAGPPDSFYAKVRGRVILADPPAGMLPRQLQARLLGNEAVVDATLHKGRVRLVLSSTAQAEPRHFSAEFTGVQYASADPRFEDAFIDRVSRPQHTSSSDFAVPVGESQPDGNSAILVRARQLRKKFGRFEAVKGLDFEVRQGEIFGLLGPNGAGKSTTFRMLCGLLAVTDGTVEVAGHNLRRSRAHARGRLGYMAQKFSLYTRLSVVENLHFYGRVYGLFGKRLRDRVGWALETFGLGDRRDEPAGDLPGGYKQRLAMAASLLHEPDLLFLDEPTSGVDPLARREFWMRINGFAEAGMTVVVTTHFLEEAEYCDRMLIMSQGSLLALGSPEEIRALARSEECPDPSMEDAFIALAEGRVHPGEGPDRGASSPPVETKPL